MTEERSEADRADLDVAKHGFYKAFLRMTSLSQ